MYVYLDVNEDILIDAIEKFSKIYYFAVQLCHFNILIDRLLNFLFCPFI